MGVEDGLMEGGSRAIGPNEEDENVLRTADWHKSRMLLRAETQNRERANGLARQEYDDLKTRLDWSSIDTCLDQLGILVDQDDEGAKDLGSSEPARASTCCPRPTP